MYLRTDRHGSRSHGVLHHAALLNGENAHALKVAFRIVRTGLKQSNLFHILFHGESNLNITNTLVQIGTIVSGAIKTIFAWIAEEVKVYPYRIFPRFYRILPQNVPNFSANTPKYARIF